MAATVITGATAMITTVAAQAAMVVITTTDALLPGSHVQRARTARPFYF
jgi:hypothetical protein